MDLSSNSKDPEQCKLDGNRAVTAGHHAEALEYYAQGLKCSSPGKLRSQLHSNSAHVLLALNRAHDAIQACEAAVAQDVHNVKAYWRGATAALSLNQYTLAIWFCERGLALVGNNKSLGCLLAQARSSSEQHCVERQRSDKCAICLSVMNEAEELIVLGCSHEFHRNCVQEMIRHGSTIACPLCRQVDLDQLCSAEELADSASLLACRIENGLHLSATSKSEYSAAALDLVNRALRLEPKNSTALYTLASLTFRGIGASCDYMKCRELLEAAASQGHAAAKLRLGAMLLDGKGGDQNVGRAHELYMSAAEQGSAEAQWAVGQLYLKGEDGIPKDFRKAMEFYEKAAAQGFIEALFGLGVIYSEGIAVPKDLERARLFYEITSARGHSRAQFNLGFFFSEGLGVARDIRKAEELYKKSALQGFAPAQTNLAMMYEDEEDFEKAREFYELSAAQGNLNAQYGLGVLCANGQGGEEDKNRALELWETAAIRGHADAQYSLGVMYNLGYGVRKDLVKAKKLWKLAAAQGQDDAKQALMDNDMT